MTSRTVRILILFIVVALTCALFLLNPQNSTVYLGQGRTWEAPLALVLIVVFFLGASFAGFLAAVTSTTASFRWWREKRNYELERSHLSQMISVRENIAAGRLEDARRVLEKIVAQDPSNVVARVLLATVLKQAGEISQALRVLDEARATQRNNFEVLFLAAELNAQVGNLTAAYDNLSLVLQADPHVKKALEEIIPHAVALGKFDAAREYKERLIRLSSGAKYQEHQLDLAALELHRASALESAERKGAIEGILKRHRDYAPALQALAEIEAQNGNAEEASKLLTKAFKISPTVSALAALAALWLKSDEPSRAVSSVRNLIGSQSKEEMLPGHLFLITLLTHLEMTDEAANELKKFEERLSQIQIKSDHREAFKSSLLILRATVLSRQNKSSEAYEILDKLRRQMSPLQGEDNLQPAALLTSTGTTTRSSQREQLAPQFSTP